MYCQHCGKFTENVDGVCESCRDTLEATKELVEESRNFTEKTQDSKVIMGEKLDEEVSEENLSTNRESFLETKEFILEENTDENSLEQKENVQHDNSGSFKKELPPSLKHIQKIRTAKWNDFVENTGKEMITVSTIKESAFLLVITLCVSTLLSVIISLIANTIFKNPINSIWGQMIGSYAQESQGGFVTFYRILRMSYLHSLKLSASTIGVSTTIHMDVHLLILSLIPFVSMFISWRLLSHQKLRISLKFLFSEETVFNKRKVLPITLNVSLALSILFFITSFIPTNFINNGYVSLKLSYGAFSSLFGTLLITLLFCYLTTGILKLRERKKLTTVSILSCLWQYYMKYSIGVVVVSILLMLITLIRTSMWKQIGTFLLALPNVILILANALSFGGFQTIDSGKVYNLRSTLSGFQVACSVFLALTWCIFLWYLLYQIYLKLEKSSAKDYIKNVGIISGIILVIQSVLYCLSRVEISIRALGEVEVGATIKTNILLSLFILVLVSAGAAVCAYYLPNLLYKKGNKEEVLLVGSWKRLDMAILIVLSIFVSLTFLGMTKVFSSSVESSSIIRKDKDSINESNSMVHPEDIEVFQGGFLFRDYDTTYTYQKGQVKRITFDENIISYFSNSDYYYSKISDRILKVNQNNAMLLDSKGKELYKQKVSFDQLLSATKEFDKLLFLVDGEITLYDKKDNNFSILDGISYNEYTDFYFDDSEEYIYLVGSTISRYDLKSKKLEVVKEQTPEYILDSQEKLTAKLYLFNDGKLVPPVGDSNKKYYAKSMTREYQTYSVIMENGKDSPISLPDMVLAETIDEEGTKFLVAFTENGDYYLYDAVKAELTNISTQIRYLTSNGKVEGEK